MLSHMRAVRQIRGLVAHGEGPDSQPEVLVQLYVQSHALEEISWCIMEVVEHVIGHLGEAALVCVSDSALVGTLEAQMIKCDAQRLYTDCRKLTQEAAVLTKNPSVHALVE